MKRKRRIRLHPGIPLTQRPLPSEIIRFLSKVKVNVETGCWFWKAYKDKKGYGQFWYQGKMVWAHRWSIQAFTGPLEYGMEAHHLCKNPCCVNPDHMQPETKAANSFNSTSFKAKECPF